jgi:hypothetical protein
MEKALLKPDEYKRAAIPQKSALQAGCHKCKSFFTLYPSSIAPNKTFQTDSPGHVRNTSSNMGKI